VSGLANRDIEVIADKFGLSEQALKVIQNIRESPPARNVQSGKGNVSGFYPSKKMGQSIQFESHTLELSAIMLKEHDSKVLEFYDQPPSFPIQYMITDKNGRTKNHGHIYTADFFVIEEDWIGWEEWKPEKDLLQLAISSPERYLLDDNGIWRCPPAEKYAARFGLSIRIKTDRDINETYQRNITFLEDYLIHTPSINEAHIIERIREVVSENPGITIKELIQEHSLDPDHIYICFIHDDIYIDLYNAVLADPARTAVFLTKELAEAYSNIQSAAKEHDPYSFVIEVEVGGKILWDGREFTFINIGESKYSLLSSDDKLVDIPVQVFETLVKNGTIAGVNTKPIENDAALQMIREADEDQLRDANMKFEYVRRVLSGEKPTDIPERTLRHWVAQYNQAETQYGNGFVGLIPKRNTQGNRYRRIHDKVLELINKYITEHYETTKQKNKSNVYRLLSSECEKQGLMAPSLRTFCEIINSRPVNEQTRKRKGDKAAYATDPFYWELDRATPRHGDRPFEICHIDHTELDIECVCSVTGRSLGRPWATFLVDANSRRLLVVYLTFDPPSYRSCMMVLRECVRRYSRLPQKLVVDGGKEFHSIYFDSLLAYYKVTKMKRPGAKPRFGSVCERLFGTTTTTFINNLLGNTQITKNVRQVTKSVNPKKLAVWTLGKLYEKLCEWAYEMYDTLDHPALGSSPRDAYMTSIALTGKRKFSMIAYNETFLMLSLPTTRKGKAKVEPGRGVKINKYYYWSEKFLHPGVEGESVPVRYDPYNMGIAYAYVLNQWILLNSSEYSAFKGKSEKEINLATEEIKRRMKIYGKQTEVSARKMAQFLNSTEAEEVLLMQRLKDNEQKTVFEIIQGGKSAESTRKTESTKTTKAPNLVVLPNLKNNTDLKSINFEQLEEF
jgi:putative transposase